MPVLVVVLGFGVWALACVDAQLRCSDAAAAAARSAARGDPPASVSATARAVAPRGAVVEVGGDPGLVRVVVRAVARPSGAVLGRLPGIDVEGRATAAREATGP